jgi:hypothetical protein
MSRVTLYRIEKGEPSVAMGAWVSAAGAVGLRLELRGARDERPVPLPKVVRLADHPQLAKLAWQLRGKRAISPREALELYERNWRHVDQVKLTRKERELIRALLQAFDRERLLV